MKRRVGMILASASPRRAELLRSAGLDVVVVPADIDETPSEGEEPETLVSRLSSLKAETVAEKHPELVVLAADTVVEHDGVILGKPADGEEAFAMLTALSGDCHEVMTGFTLRFPDGQALTRVVITEVEFRSLSEKEIRDYIATGDAVDKAGGYGIQSGAAGFVKRISGSYTNVVGLPLAEVLENLRSNP